MKLAVFDIDGTLFRSSLLIEMVNQLIAEHIFPDVVSQEIEEDYKQWLYRKGSYENYIMSVIKVYCRYMTGKEEKVVHNIAARLLQEQKNKLYRFTRDLIPYLKRHQYHLFAVSTSPSIIVSQFASMMGFDNYEGTNHTAENGIIVHHPLEPCSKKDVFMDFINKKKNIDLSSSIAVGDTKGDIPLLEMVGIPIAFNPNTELAMYAKRSKWKIIVERKDVIYDLTQWKPVREMRDFLPDL